MSKQTELLWGVSYQSHSSQPIKTSPSPPEAREEQLPGKEQQHLTHNHGKTCQMAITSAIV